MTDLLHEKKRGSKLTIIDQCDYDDYKIICDVIKEKGYKIVIVENGNTILERVKND